MYVRNLELKTENNLNPIGEVFEAKEIAKRTLLNNIPFIVVDLFLLKKPPSLTVVMC
jgi:hypothetical protein